MTIAMTIENTTAISVTPWRDTDPCVLFFWVCRIPLPEQFNDRNGYDAGEYNIRADGRYRL